MCQPHLAVLQVAQPEPTMQGVSHARTGTVPTFLYVFTGVYCSTICPVV